MSALFKTHVAHRADINSLNQEMCQRKLKYVDLLISYTRLFLGKIFYWKGCEDNNRCVTLKCYAIIKIPFEILIHLKNLITDLFSQQNIPFYLEGFHIFCSHIQKIFYKLKRFYLDGFFISPAMLFKEFLRTKGRNVSYYININNV